MSRSNVPQYGPPTAPPYLPRPQPHHLQPPTTGGDPGVHHPYQPSAPSAHYHPASHGNGFDSVDLESGPNSPRANVSRPMMPLPPTRQCHHQLTPANDNNNTEGPPNKKHLWRCKPCMLVGAAVLLIVLLAVAVGFAVLYAGVPREPVPATRLHTNCVSCAVLETALIHSDGRMAVNVAELDMKTMDGKLLCCLKVSDKTDAILEMLLEQARQTGPSTRPILQGQTQNQNQTNSPTTQSEAAARVHHRNQVAALVGIEKELPAVNDDVLYVLKEWGVTTSSALYIRPGILYNRANGHFTVPRDGLYNVNIHLSLSNYGDEMKTFRQRLIRFNRFWPAMGDETLASDMENVPSGEQRTSSLALTLHLRKDDELFSQVNPAGLVVDISSMSFFCIVYESA